jgi:hypothetical protein
VPASAYGVLADGGFLARLGSGLRLSAQDLAGAGVDLSAGPQPLPGVRLRHAAVRDTAVVVTGELAVPHLATGEVTAEISAAGTARLRGTARRTLELPALGNPQLAVSLDETGALAGALDIAGVDLARGIRGLTATASGRLTIAGGRMSGGGRAELAYKGLGSGELDFRFTEAGAFAAGGTVHLAPPFLDPIDLDLALDEQQNLTAAATLDLATRRSPLPGLTVSTGTITLGYRNGRPSASVANFAAAYGGFASVSVPAFALDASHRFAGSGALTLTVPLLDPVQGTVRIAGGAVSGSLRIPAESFPAGLPVRGGVIMATLSEAGQVGFAGTVRVDLGPAGRGDLTASYAEGRFAMGAEVDLTVPGLVTAHVSVAYADGTIAGEVAVPVDPALLPGLDGQVVVRFAEGRWSGETALAFSADDGKLSGTVTVTVAQAEDGTLQLGGTGSLTAQLLPQVAGTLTATILPEGGVDVSGAIVVTEPVELFGEQRLDKELFSHSQNIPLWAILVAVLRVRAGVRAGIGPGVFRNIQVEGSYTLGSQAADPSFAVSGELYIPAFVEGYVAFGAGLGLDVVLGSLTGGIEGVATAGLYGAISVVPELAYRDGEWGIEGTAVLAAGARLKLGLNAWAEVEALWVTVWENEWKLAEHVWPIGPDLALRAHMNYTFGRPTPPELDFSTSDIDATALIQAAMPEDGPAPSGAREALQNRAEWQGALREQRAAAALPPELAAQAQEGERPPEVAPPPPDNAPGPPAGGAQATGGGPNQDPAATPTPGNELARSAEVDEAAKPDPSVQGSVPESAVPNADHPRYPGPITLEMLDEPPAPMPRTRAQEEQDLDAARRAVELASAQASDSDALDNYFPRIKNRFGLTSLGYEGDFERGFQVVGSINPAFVVRATETLTATGIPAVLQKGHITKITFDTSRFSGVGDDVGVRMEANPLGPDHPAGSGPTGQDMLRKLLPTDPGVYPDVNRRYVRGHLLNDNIGGPGQPRNLFPITAAANKKHETQVESSVKKWVNVDRYWVHYTVEVTGDDRIMQTSSTPPVNFVNATIRATASVLDTNLNDVFGTREVTIESTYDVPAAAALVTEEDTAALATHTPRPIDKTITVLESTRKGDTTITFPAEIEAKLKKRIEARGTDWVARQLRTFTGFGPAHEEVLFKAYDEVKRRGDKTVRGLTEGEAKIFTHIRNTWSEGLAATLGG